MKILYISSVNIWGGSSVALINMAHYMKCHGHEVCVFTSARKGRFLDELKNNSIKCHLSRWDYPLTIWPKTKNPLTFIKRCIRLFILYFFVKRELLKVVKQFQPDIVHTNIGPLDIALRLCQKLSIPHVWHMREYQDKDFDMHFFPLQFLFRRKIKSKGNYNLAITKDIFNYWNLRPGIDRVIYDGVFSSQILPKQIVKDKENYILFVGRIEPAKAPYILIRAYKEFITRYGNNSIKLKLAGTFNENSPYSIMCTDYIRENNIAENVDFLGERKDVYLLMSKAMCLVVPSESEGFGFITVEGMVNYCPVLGRMTGGTKEQLINGLEYEGAPIAIPFNDEEDLVEALHVVTTKDTGEMVERAYDMVKSHYTIEKCGEEVEKFYKDILQSK